MSSDPRDYKLDISSLSASGQTEPQANPHSRAYSKLPAEKRPYLSVLFECCTVYQRVYRNPEDRAYIARCPRCGRSATFPVGEGGTTDRTFRVR
jgi:hypothetical protein